MLIKTLAHAANIRTPRPQDRITLVVGALEDSATYSYTRSTGTPYGTSGVVVSGRSSSTRSRGRTDTTAAAPATGIMIMHAAKSDVDAFARSQLPLAQFTEKVQTLWSWPNWGASTAGNPPAVPAPATRW
jgi:hypothetical protein